jgi:hypothetical protein
LWTRNGTHYLAAIANSFTPLKLCFSYVRGLRTVLAFGDFKFNLIAFLQALVSLARDGAEVNKNIGAILSSDEPVSLRVIEPLYGAFHALLAGIRCPRNLCLGESQKPILNYDASLRD